MNCKEITLEGQTNAADPLVSVIIPVYNVLPYLREALDSVINQSYRNLEILIVDDGSTDGSGAVCDEYLYDPRVRVIHQENRGLSGARNTALELMTGEFVAFLDSDDAMRPDMIRQMVQAAEREGVDVVICGFDRIKTEGPLAGAEVLEIRCPPTAMLSPAEALNHLMTGELTHNAWGKLYRSYLWKGVRFPEGHVYEDVHTTCRTLEKSSRIQLLSERLYLYRIRSGSIIRTHTLKNYQDLMFAHRVHEDFVNRRRGEVFSDRSIRAFMDQNQCILELTYAEWTPLIPAEDRAEWVALRETLLESQKTNCHATRLKSTAVHWLFRHCPASLSALRTAFRFCKG